jgi:hypothetical protein
MAARPGLSSQFDGDLVDLAGECIVALLVVVGDRRASIPADVSPLVGGEGDTASGSKRRGLGLGYESPSIQKSS